MYVSVLMGVHGLSLWDIISFLDIREIYDIHDFKSQPGNEPFVQFICARGTFM